MPIDEILIGLPIVASFLLLGNTALSRAPLLSCISKSTAFLLTAILFRGVDLLSEVLMLTSSITGVSISFYTYSYSKIKYGGLGLTSLVDLFLLSMILLFRAKTFIEFVTFWLLTELLAFFLIAYDYIVKDDSESLRASVKYLVFSMIPTDLSLFILLAMVGFEKAFTISIPYLGLEVADKVVLLIVMLGFFSKAAVIPLHFWLPDAHSYAPSPASALLSGLMVKMGLYALYILSLQRIDIDLASSTTIVLGGLTALYGAAQAAIQRNIKRLLAYSTTSETGLLTMVLGLYVASRDSVFIGVLAAYSVAHALYKAFMFMDAGYIEVVMRTCNIDELGYVVRASPLETTSTLMAIASYLGMPPSIGFLAKLALFSTISKHLTDLYICSVALALATLKTAISVIYNAAYLKAHLGGERRPISWGSPPKEEAMLRVSCLIGSIYLYVMPLVLTAVLVYSVPVYIGLEAPVSVLTPLLPSIAIVLALYPLVYVSIRHRDVAHEF